MNYGLIAIVVLSVVPSISLGQSSQERDQLAERVIEVWPIENAAIVVLQKTGAEVIRNSRAAISGRLTPDEQEKVIEEVVAEVDIYLKEMTPVVLSYAMNLKPTILGPFLEQNFDEAELAELIRIMESPVRRKFQELTPAIQSQYQNDVIAASSVAVKPELEVLMKKVSEKLNAAVKSQ